MKLKSWAWAAGLTVIGLILGTVALGQLLGSAYAQSNYQAPVVDTNLVESGFDTYAKVSQVIICEIDKSPLYQDMSSEDWFKSLYFYSITQLHFYDIPYNFVYDDGVVFKGRQSEAWVDLQPLVKDSSGISLIGVTDLTKLNTESFKEFIAYILDTYELSAEAVIVKKCTIERVDVQDSFVSQLSIMERTLSALETETFELAMEGVSVPNNVTRSYLGIVSNVTNEEYIDPDKSLEVAITIENTGEYTWYAQDEFYVVTNSELMHDSQYYLSSSWASRSHVGLLNSNIPAGESTQFTFRLKPGLMPGEYTENFVIVDKNKTPIAGTEFSVHFITNNVDYEFVRVKENEWGFLNVRENPSTSAEIITKVSPGEVFIVVDRLNSWYKIKIDETREGWVSATYVEFL